MTSRVQWKGQGFCDDCILALVLIKRDSGGREIRNYSKLSAVPIYGQHLNNNFDGILGHQHTIIKLA